MNLQTNYIIRLLYYTILYKARPLVLVLRTQTLNIHPAKDRFEAWKCCFGVCPPLSVYPSQAVA